MRIIQAIVAILLLAFVSGGCSPCSAERCRINATDASIQALHVACGIYSQQCGRLPPQEVGLKALVENQGVASWGGPYVKGGIPRDAWGNEFRYSVTNGVAIIESAGPDGRFDTADDKDGTPKESRTSGCTRF